MDDVRTSSAWTGWVGFAAIMLVIIGGINVFEGLIGIIRGSYYAIAPNQVIVFDTTTWGWITLILGLLFVLVGLALAAKSGWARWTAVAIIIINLFDTFGYLGSAGFTLWSLTSVTLQIVVLFALTARWGEVASY
jgi:hypothetical protein